MSRAASVPPRLARGALVILCSLSAQVALRHAHADVARPTPVDRAESANKWVVLAISGTAAFMTTLDASIVNIALPSIDHLRGLARQGALTLLYGARDKDHNQAAVLRTVLLERFGV